LARQLGEVRVFFLQAHTVHKHLNSLSLSLSLCLRFNGHFPGEPGLAGFSEAKHDGSGGDNWSYKTCKSSSQIVTTNKPTPNYLQAGCLSCCPNKNYVPRTCSPQTHMGVFQLCLWPLKAPG